MSDVILTASERAWLTQFCPGLKAGGRSCLEATPHTLCQACFTHGSVRAILAARCATVLTDAELAAWKDREATLQREIIHAARVVANTVPESGPTTVYGHLPEWCALRVKIADLDAFYADASRSVGTGGAIVPLND